MDNARGTALFLIFILVTLSVIVFAGTKKLPENATEAVKDEGTNFKGKYNTGLVYALPMMTLPTGDNVSANGYAGQAPRL